MKTLEHWYLLPVLVAVGLLASCTQTPKSPDVSDNIRRSLTQAGLRNVSITQDRDKGVVTLGGHVASEGEKAQADSMARSIANGQVVADEIEVLPPGVEKEAKAINSDLDKGIEQNLDAALIQNRLHDYVKYSVKNQVVTLTGDIGSQGSRGDAGRLAASVPNVQQVVNELQVKNQKATSPQ